MYNPEDWVWSLYTDCLFRQQVNIKIPAQFFSDVPYFFVVL